MIAVPKITERIRKASRHCLTDGCEGCPYWDGGMEGDDPSCDQIAILEDAIRLTAAVELLRSEKDADPTVEPKRGRWISENSRTNSWTFLCSACGGKAYFPRMGKRDGSKVRCGYEYCPHCKAIMEGVEE